MSPINKPTTIKELDGLPAGEIDFRIAQSEQRTKQFLEARLNTQDEKLDTMQQDLSALVGTPLVAGMIKDIKTSIDAVRDRQEEQAGKHSDWHEADLTFRTEVITRVGTIETEQKKMTGQMRMIRWFVATSKGVSKCLELAIKALTEADFWKVFGAAGLMWALSHYAPAVFKVVAEYVKQ
ncbi:hypothetical protein [Granulicella tundricola]|uniref:Uncharacterized protein n=1 Tax=Granulicella tundricola (strain ATCC BAA-1859 / DSM 23138 / MP5ACTX9) TaxID=1198114 RepID=E8X0S3_GRATM|nr:hypothetical protein [Granulicella tundricola]ADW69024.1 hypothetical protein AciX9_1978 [Granulicella tundricola MP5ACTX9]